MMYTTTISHPPHPIPVPVPVPVSKRPPTIAQPGSPVTPPLNDPTTDTGLHLLCIAAGASPILSQPPLQRQQQQQPPPPPPRPQYYPAPPPPAQHYYMPPAYLMQAPPPPATYYTPYYHALSITQPPTTPTSPATSTEIIRKVKGPWRKEEDELLTALVARYGARRWTTIAAHIPGRTGKQARERWLNQLSPDLAKRPWNDNEDRIVMEAHAKLGNRWSEIAKLLKGRTDNAVKNRFNTTIRRQISQLAGQKRPLHNHDDEHQIRDTRQRCS